MSSLEQGAWTQSTENFRPAVGQTKVFFKAVQVKQNYLSGTEHTDKSLPVPLGRPVYKEVIHIVKVTADAQFNRPERPKVDQDELDYPQEWAAWCATKESKVLGYPIAHVPWLSETQIAEFTAAHVTTVEQLANMPDIQAQKFMGMTEIRQKAKVFLNAGQDLELIANIRKEASSKEAALQAQIDELKALIEAKTAPGK